MDDVQVAHLYSGTAQLCKACTRDMALLPSEA